MPLGWIPIRCVVNAVKSLKPGPQRSSFSSSKLQRDHRGSKTKALSLIAGLNLSRHFTGRGGSREHTRRCLWQQSHRCRSSLHCQTCMCVCPRARVCVHAREGRVQMQVRLRSFRTRTCACACATPPAVEHPTFTKTACDHSVNLQGPAKGGGKCDQIVIGRKQRVLRRHTKPCRVTW